MNINEEIKSLQYEYREVAKDMKGKLNYIEESKRLDVIKDKIAELYSDDKKLAIYLHSKLCSCCGCNWNRAISSGHHSDWNDSGHKEWLDKAKQLLELSDNDLNKAKAITDLFK